MRWYNYRVQRWVLVLVCCVALFGGVVLARFTPLASAGWLWVVAACSLLMTRRHNLVTLAILSMLSFGIGWWRGTAAMQQLASNESLYRQKITLIAQATEDAVYGDRYQLVFSASNAQVVEPQAARLAGSILLKGFGEPAINRGDVVQATGKLYPYRGNNLSSMSFAELRVVRHDSSWINDWRRRFAAGMQSALPEPAASFGLGLVIGQRSTLPDSTSDQLRHAGLTHIIAVSGYNLTIIVLACQRLFAKRSKFQSTAGCLLLIGFFLLVTGFSPPIIRASIVSLLSIAAWYYGRRIQPLVLLCVAAAITVVANPMYLWGNVSWYLSFLAFFGVLVLAPLLTKRLMGDKEPRVLTGILVESACASLLVLPYILFVFGETTLAGLPANLLVIPFIPAAMLLVLVAGLAGMVAPALAGWVAWPAQWLLVYMLDVAKMISRVPHAYVSHIGFSATWLVVSYAAIGVVCVVLWGKTRKSGIITDNIEEQKGV